MRALVAMLIVAAATLSTSPGHAAGKCQSDPIRASKAVWNWGELRTGEQKTGTHPCGRQITCSGGKFEPQSQTFLPMDLILFQAAGSCTAWDHRTPVARAREHLSAERKRFRS